MLLTSTFGQLDNENMPPSGCFKPDNKCTAIFSVYNIVWKGHIQINNNGLNITVGKTDISQRALQYVITGPWPNFISILS